MIAMTTTIAWQSVQLLGLVAVYGIKGTSTASREDLDAIKSLKEMTLLFFTPSLGRTEYVSTMYRPRVPKSSDYVVSSDILQRVHVLGSWYRGILKPFSGESVGLLGRINYLTALIVHSDKP